MDIVTSLTLSMSLFLFKSVTFSGLGVSMSLVCVTGSHPGLAYPLPAVSTFHISTLWSRVQRKNSCFVHFWFGLCGVVSRPVLFCCGEYTSSELDLGLCSGDISLESALFRLQPIAGSIWQLTNWRPCKFMLELCFPPGAVNPNPKHIWSCSNKNVKISAHSWPWLYLHLWPFL